MSNSAKSIYVPQGHFEISASPDVYITTVLGSCVAACIWDDTTKMGGMNHILLPPSSIGKQSSEGVHLMELLINALLKKGAIKSRLKVKLFGGARMIDGLSDVGGRNAAFAKDFFRFEGLEVVAESLGGTHARRVQFWPATGVARQRFVANHTIEKTAPPPRKPKSVDHTGDIDLF